MMTTFLWTECINQIAEEVLFLELLSRWAIELERSHWGGSCSQKNTPRFWFFFYGCSLTWDTSENGPRLLVVAKGVWIWTISRGGGRRRMSLIWGFVPAAPTLSSLHLCLQRVKFKHGSRGSCVVTLTGGARSAAFLSALELCVSMVKETPSEFPVRDTCILLMLSGKRLEACWPASNPLPPPRSGSKPCCSNSFPL